MNADGYASTGQGFIGYNMFAYCGNNLVIVADHNGENQRLVGGGVQLEGSCGLGTFGAELVVYTDETICQNQEYVICVYVYGGGGLTEDAENLIYDIIKNKDTLKSIASGNPLKCDASLSAFLIWGDDSFNSIYDYEGAFTSVSATASNIHTYYSFSSSAKVVGAGGAFKNYSFGVSHTYYSLFYTNKRSSVFKPSNMGGGQSSRIANKSIAVTV